MVEKAYFVIDSERERAIDQINRDLDSGWKIKIVTGAGGGAATITSGAFMVAFFVVLEK